MTKRNAGPMPIVIEGFFLGASKDFVHLGGNEEELKKSIALDEIVIIEIYDEYDELLEEMDLDVPN